MDVDPDSLFINQVNTKKKPTTTKRPFGYVAYPSNKNHNKSALMSHIQNKKVLYKKIFIFLQIFLTGLIDNLSTIDGVLCILIKCGHNEDFYVELRAKWFSFRFLINFKYVNGVTVGPSAL